ncbi:uncharacterized protein METZ01_LOCUS344290, partial [marine metagenome]
MLLMEEDMNEPGGAGRDKVKRVIRKLRESDDIRDVYKYIVKKTVDVLFCDEKDAYLFDLMLKEEDWASVQELIELARGGPSITRSDITSFRDKLEALGWLDKKNTEEGYFFRIYLRYKTQVMLSRGDVRDEEDRVPSEAQRELEDWERFFGFEAIVDDSLIGGVNLDDHRRLERISRRLLGEKTKAPRGSLLKDLEKIRDKGLSKRKTLLLENIILADNIVRKYTSGQLEAQSKEIDKVIVQLEEKVILAMLFLVRDFGDDNSWKCVRDGSSQIRQVISRLALDPDPLGIVEERIARYIDGLHALAHQWPLEDISSNQQLDVILHS